MRLEANGVLTAFNPPRNLKFSVFAPENSFCHDMFELFRVALVGVVGRADL